MNWKALATIAALTLTLNACTSTPTPQSSPAGDAIKGDAMKKEGDAMKKEGDAMKGDAMKGDAMKKEGDAMDSAIM